MIEFIPGPGPTAQGEWGLLFYFKVLLIAIM